MGKKHEKKPEQNIESVYILFIFCLYSVYILFALLMMVKSQYNGRTYEQLSAQMLGIENLMTQMVGQVVGRVNLQATSLTEYHENILNRVQNICKHSEYMGFQSARLDWVVFKESVNFSMGMNQSVWTNGSWPVEQLGLNKNAIVQSSIVK